METEETMDRTAAEISRDKVVGDFKTLIHDAEELFKVTKDGLGDRAKEARERLGVALGHAKDSFHELEDKASEKARATDKIIRSHPYESIGIAFGVGLLIGVLVNRR